MPLRILRLHGLVSASLIRGFLVMGMYSTFFLVTLYLEQVHGYSALETGAGVPAVDADRGGALARDHGTLVGVSARFPSSPSGMAIAAAGLLLLTGLGPDTAFFPTTSSPTFAIGFGIGTPSSRC